MEKLTFQIFFIDIVKVELLKMVFYVPGLKFNLLSVGHLEDKNYKVTIKKQVCTISNN